MVCEDKTEEVRSSGTRAWRNNNPGNVRPGKLTSGTGEVGVAGGFQVYPDESTGTAALGSLLSSPFYQSKSVDGAIAAFAPAFENNTVAYQRAVRAGVGAAGGTALSDLTSGQMQALVRTIRRVEGWTPGTVTYRPWKP